ncbi:MAG: hypothetical protein ACXWR0_16935 [Bdellovibrio sp.]
MTGSIKRKNKVRGWAWCAALFSFMGCLNTPNLLNVASAYIVDDQNSSNHYRIDYDERELNFPYGVYRELEVNLAGGVTSDVVWENVDGILPPGLNLETTSRTSVRIFGAGKFSDRWCFALRASHQNQFSVSREICLNGTYNSKIDYPQLTRSALLPNAEVGTVYSVKLPYKAKKNNTYKGTVLLQQFIKGITVSFQPKQNQFLLSGTAKRMGVYRFITKLTDKFGREVSRQYQFEVIPKIVHQPPPSPMPGPAPQPLPEPTYQCPAGYYYNSILGYCVEDRSTSCPAGTYYDSYSNSCLPYNTDTYCGTGYYYDHFLNRCVRQEYPRCPWNYEYSDYYGRCIRQSYTCDIGYEYDWSTRECRRSEYSRSCDRDSYWDYQLRRCVPHWRGCDAGYRWDTYSRRCVRAGDNCSYGEYYDPQFGRCTRRNQSCEPGSRYNYQTGRCEYDNNNSSGRCRQGQHWDYQRQTCVNDNQSNPPPSRPNCVEQPQTPVACADYAGQYGIPAKATQGNASWTKNSCSGEIKYTGGCSEPTSGPAPTPGPRPGPRCEDVPQSPVSCSQYAGQYGIPSDATQGNASWTKNSCSGEIKYTGGCSVPTSTPTPAPRPAPRCEDVPQSPVSCSQYAGQYGIPSDATQGRASWTKNSCTGDVKYTGGCSVPTPTPAPRPAPRCEDVPQSPVSCSQYAGQYGIPSDATQGRASWTKNSCTGDVTYTGGCSVPAPAPRPAPRCEDVPQSSVSCSQYAGQFGIPSDATEGRASWTKNSCTGDVTYTGGCSVPSRPRCEDVPQSPVSCSQYAGQFGIPSGATHGSASWTKNSCSGDITYTGGCY